MRDSCPRLIAALWLAWSLGSPLHAAEAPAVLFSATPAPMHLAFSPFIRDSSSFYCATFAVRALTKLVPGAVITTTGLGGTTISVVNSKTTCATPRDERVAVELVVTTSPVLLRLRIPRSIFPPAGEHIEGKLHLAAWPKLAVETPVRLEGPDLSIPVKAAAWFIGFLLPALATAALASFGFIAQKRYELRQEENIRYNKLVTSRWNDLNEIFTSFLPILNSKVVSNKQWVHELKDKLDENGLDQIPQRHLQSLLRALAEHNCQRVMDQLRKAFPDWKRAIHDARSRQRNST